MMSTEISAMEVKRMMEQGQQIDLVDVRTPVEYREVHAEGARLVPLDRLDPAALMRERNGRGGEPLYLICKSGSRSRTARQKFEKAGFENVVCIDGGTEAWEKAGLPVVRGKKAMSLERQVRIVAGLLVMVGVVLGVLVSPWFLMISGLVGAGLVFAGVTDFCGMALLLGRMPWNQVKGEEPGCAR
jgi:rhodanese-related sulfurtransferase